MLSSVCHRRSLSCIHHGIPFIPKTAFRSSRQWQFQWNVQICGICWCPKEHEWERATNWNLDKECGTVWCDVMSNTVGRLSCLCIELLDKNSIFYLKEKNKSQSQESSIESLGRVLPTKMIDVFQKWKWLGNREVPGSSIQFPHPRKKPLSFQDHMPKLWSW